jgi:hypothetical protein
MSRARPVDRYGKDDCGQPRIEIGQSIGNLIAVGRRRLRYRHFTVLAQHIFANNEFAHGIVECALRRPARLQDMRVGDGDLVMPLPRFTVERRLHAGRVECAVGSFAGEEPAPLFGFLQQAGGQRGTLLVLALRGTQAKPLALVGQ